MAGEQTSSIRLGGGGKVTVRVDVNDAKLGSVFQAKGRRAMRRITSRIATEAQRQVPVKTGYLKRSIREDAIGTRGLFRIQSWVTATAPYAEYVHEGSRPHVIRARNYKYLRFMGREGRYVFRKSVNHPGYRGNPFLTRAADIVVLRDLQKR